jgi:transcriptional regulator with XRE-family HTH domain
MSFVGDLIRKTREEKNITQKSLAEYLGFSNVFLGRIEAGKCGLPVEYTHKLAKRIGLEREEILKQMRRDLAANLRRKAGG